MHFNAANARGDVGSRQRCPLVPIPDGESNRREPSCDSHDYLGEDYALLRLARVREQLNRIDRMIATETDPQKLDRLAAATMRLSDQEFALAGRPKPGNRKPAPELRREQVRPSPVPMVPRSPASPLPAPPSAMDDPAEDDPEPPTRRAWLSEPPE
jgi:hypothetical protein